MGQQHRPFAITAHCPGNPDKLFTPITVAYISAKRGISVARANAMWDTGADVCYMTAALAAELHIPLSKAAPMRRLVDDGRAYVGFAMVVLVSNGEMVKVTTGIVDGEMGEFSFVLGMNFISLGTLSICSTDFDTTLSFVVTSPEPIDFTRISKGMSGALPLSSTAENIAASYGEAAFEMIIPR